MSQENRNPQSFGGYKLLDALLEKDVLDAEQCRLAADHADREGVNARAALVELGILEDEVLRQFLVEHTGYPVAPEEHDEDLLDLFPVEERVRHGLTPFKVDAEGVHIGFCDPVSKQAWRAAGNYAPGTIIPYVAFASQVEVGEVDDLAALGVAEEVRPRPRGSQDLKLKVAPEVLGLLDDEFVRRHRIIPFALKDEMLHVYMDSSTSLLLLDDVRNLTGYEISVEYHERADLEDVIDAYFDEESNLDELAMEAGAEFDLQSSDEEDDAGVSDSAIVKIVNGILRDAIAREVSDIHIHPREDGIQVRFRVDGVLQSYQELPMNLLPALIARIKVLSGLDIAKKRIPQDGRLRYRNAGRHMDFRVSTLPTVVGEKAVLRLLKGSDELLKIPQLGFSEYNRERFIRAIEQPYGMFLVTGPTGSGKSFTLFSAMDHLNSPDVNILTVEDPVEYRLPGLAQVQTNNKAGLSFAAALRSFLRQDPDIIMVGEIRDEETAKIATESALTGHLVLATLHTNDAAGAITRLTEMGVDRFNINASLLGVLAQRLARRVCKFCSAPATPDPKIAESLGVTEEMLSNGSYQVGVGCDECGDTGYRGRTGIHELLTMNADLERAIGDSQPTDRLREIGRKTGMTTLREDAVAKALQGITTFEEVLRITAE